MTEQACIINTVTYVFSTLFVLLSEKLLSIFNRKCMMNQEVWKFFKGKEKVLFIPHYTISDLHFIIFAILQQWLCFNKPNSTH